MPSPYFDEFKSLTELYFTLAEMARMALVTSLIYLFRPLLILRHWYLYIKLISLAAPSLLMPQFHFILYLLPRRHSRAYALITAFRPIPHIIYLAFCISSFTGFHKQFHRLYRTGFRPNISRSSLTRVDATHWPLFRHTRPLAWIFIPSPCHNDAFPPSLAVLHYISLFHLARFTRWSSLYSTCWNSFVTSRIPATPPRMQWASRNSTTYWLWASYHESIGLYFHCDTEENRGHWFQLIYTTLHRTCPGALACRRLFHTHAADTTTNSQILIHTFLDNKLRT
jgi:hypothetical protein